MPRSPVSVTLDDDNLLWLRSRTRAERRRSLSDTLDRLVTEARLGAAAAESQVRSVVGTIDIAAGDPDLASADALLGDLFGDSVRRPMLVRERPPVTARAARRRRPRRG